MQISLLLPPCVRQCIIARLVAVNNEVSCRSHCGAPSVHGLDSGILGPHPLPHGTPVNTIFYVDVLKRLKGFIVSCQTSCEIENFVMTTREPTPPSS
ncbi:hypothetical protein V5799_012312 [Amblyomma americanum]|uniref:Uncharacterized protein n=1 Tax=Amblyomma americanum TaxID=6943 RepID=A0AAQ4EEJ6_AMBAM